YSPDLNPFGTWQFRFIDCARDLGFLRKPDVETRAAKDVAGYLACPPRRSGRPEGTRPTAALHPQAFAGRASRAERLLPGRARKWLFLALFSPFRRRIIDRRARAVGVPGNSPRIRV